MPLFPLAFMPHLPDSLISQVETAPFESALCQDAPLKAYGNEH
jgi:hypothetical protein